MTPEVIHLTIQHYPSNDLPPGSSLRWACLWLLGRATKGHPRTQRNMDVVFRVSALFLRFPVKTKNVLFLGKYPFLLNYKDWYRPAGQDFLWVMEKPFFSWWSQRPKQHQWWVQRFWTEASSLQNILVSKSKFFRAIIGSLDLLSAHSLEGTELKDTQIKANSSSQANVLA